MLELTPGSSETVAASLYGGSGADAEDFIWELEDSSLAEIGFARGNCVVKTLRTGLTRLYAKHPKAAYPYTFIIYSYGDDFTQSYLTTGNNIVTINRAEEGTRTLEVHVEHAGGPTRQAGFSWEVVEGTRYVAVTPNGEKALLTPLENGLALLRVRYESCVYPLDILVRVTKTVQNVYVTTSTSTLIVTGDKSANIYAELAGDYKGFVNPDGFVWSVADEADASQIMEWAAVGNTFSVSGKYNGTAKVRVTHELSDWARTVLVVLREQAGSAKDASMYITTSSNYVQTKAGAEESVVRVSLAGGVPGDERFLRWEAEGGENNPVIRLRTATGSVAARGAALSVAGSFAYGDIYITPLREGEALISVTHPKILYSTDIIVRVYSRYALLEEPAVIRSDISVLKILNGQSVMTEVAPEGNREGADENGITWESEDAGTVEISPKSGPRTLVTARGLGNNQTYIAANHAKAAGAKRILVLSADTQEALDAMKYIYTENAYIREKLAKLQFCKFNRYKTHVSQPVGRETAGAAQN